MEKRLDEIISDINGVPKVKCPKCKSRNLTNEINIDCGLAKLGPSWCLCKECEHLFIKDLEEEEEK